MGVTIEITISNNVTRTRATSIYNTANGALTSGIGALVQLLAEIINKIVSNFLLFCCIGNPTQALTPLSGALYSTNDKLVKNDRSLYQITIEITTSNNVTKNCATTSYNTSNGSLTSGISAFLQILAQIKNNIFVFNFLFFAVFEFQHRQ